MLPRRWLKPGAKVILDLGLVKEIAEVSVNGKAVGGILWKPPYRAEVTLCSSGEEMELW